MAQLPLEGIKILDFGWILIGPQCSEYLAAMGADVIRIESNVQVDTTRLVPPFAENEVGVNRAGLFNSINRGKRDILLNLSQPKAIEMVKEIIQRWQPDILLENFIAGTMKRRGLAYEDVKAIKPDIIYASMTLLGYTGPDAWHMGWGTAMQSRTGISWLSGHPERQYPIGIGGGYADYPMAGAVTAAVMAALWGREVTGKGQFIDFAQNDAVIQTLADAMMDYTMNGGNPSMRGNREPLYAPQGTYKCAGQDDWVAISVSSDQEWAALCTVMGRPELAQDPRFADALSRHKNHDEIDRIITEWTKERPPREAQDSLQEAGVPAGAVVDTELLVTDPHLQERGFFIESDHDEIGVRLYGGWPVRFSDSELRVGKPPLMGQHNMEVYGGILGLSEAEIGKLIEEKVIF